MIVEMFKCEIFYRKIEKFIVINRTFHANKISKEQHKFVMFLFIRIYFLLQMIYIDGDYLW